MPTGDRPGPASERPTLRLWHLLFAVFVAALALVLAREEVGRVTLIVFTTGLGLIVLGTASVMLLFRTFGSIGHARDAFSALEGVGATVGVLFFGASAMWAVLWCGVAMVRMAIK